MCCFRALLRALSFVALCLICSFSFAQLRSELVTGGLTLPVGIVQSPTDPSVIFVVEQRSGTTGRVRVVQNGILLTTPFLSITGVSTGSEQGLLGLVFAPDYAASGIFYVNYTDATGATNVVQYRRSASNPLLADPASASLILKLVQPFANHNGGDLIFGPDGYLYIGLGDGGSGNDPGNRAQDLTVLFGKMLRVDPTRDDFPADPNRNYGVPPGNPFVSNASVLPEIWALGLRNPWRYTVDPASMLGYDTWLIADVGQNSIEEIDYEFPGQGGRNYGWRVWEGDLNTGLGGLSSIQPVVTFPIYEYDHTIGQAITGGYVYRGVELGPEFFGRYFYGDYVASRIWSLGLNVDPVNKTVSSFGNTEHTAALGVSGNVSTFGIDANGELLYTNYATGQIYRIRASGRVWMTDLAPYASFFLSGTLRHLVAFDGNSVRITPEPTGSRGGALDFKGGILVGFKTDQMSATTLNTTIVLSTNQSVGGTAHLLLHNWTTDAFVDVGSGAFGTSPTTVTISNVPAGAYRRADGRIEARIRGDVTVSSLASRTIVSIDQVRIVAN